MTLTDRRPKATPLSAGLVPLLGGLLILLLSVLVPGGSGRAQAGSSDPADGAAVSLLADDILIQGLGFARLNLAVAADDAMNGSDGLRQLTRLMEKNLCWTGLFTLVGGTTGYCAPAAPTSRIDMRVEFGLSGRNLRLRLVDNGPEALTLFEDLLPVALRITEDELIDAINRLAERITGQYGLLGSTLAFVMKQPGYAKVVVATTTHGERKRLITRNRDINLLPRFSPDGESMVYTVLGKRGSQVIYYDLATATATPLTAVGSLNTGGAFSPDGSQLVVTISERGNADLFTIALSGLRSGKPVPPRQITHRRGIETQADWSPDGGRLVFVSDRSGSPQVYLHDLSSGADLRLTFEGVYNVDPRWSPDGRHILFTSRRRVTDARSGQDHMVDRIMIMDSYGENVRPVTGGRYDSEQAEWSPDGNQIVFASKRKGVYKLFVVSADGQHLRRLTDTAPAIEETSPTWTRRRLIR